MNGRDRLLLPAVLAAAFLAPAFATDLQIPDEPRVAHTALGMAGGGGLLLPRVNGAPFLETPPGYYWVLAAWLRLAGPDPDGNARVPSVLFSLGTLWLVARAARRHHGAGAGFAAAAVLAATAQFWEVGGRVVVDTGHAFFTTLAFLQLGEVLAGGDVSLRRGALLGIATGLAFLAKGIPGPAFVAATAAAAVLLRLCRRERLARLILPFGAAALAAFVTAGAWALPFAASHPGMLRELVLDHVVRRAAEGGLKDPSNWLFLLRLLGQLLPWTPLLPLAIAWHARRARRGGHDGRWSELLLLWAVVPLVALLLSGSKRNLYLLPAFPAYALLAAAWLERFLAGAGAGRVWGAIGWTILAAAFLGILAGVAFARTNDSLNLPAWIALALLLACLGARWLHRGGPAAPAGETPRLALALAVLGVSTWGTAFHAATHPERSLAAFGRRVAARAGEAGEVVGYRLNQREAAALAWYLRRAFPEVDAAQALPPLLEERRLEPSGGGVRAATARSFIVAGEAAALEELARLPGGEAIAAGETVVEKDLGRRKIRAVVAGEAGGG